MPQDRTRLAAALTALRTGSRTGWHGELRLRLGAGDGRDLWVDAVLGRIEGAAGAVPSVTAQFLDTTARKRAEQQLSHLALHDELTGLPNRALWRERAEQALQAARDGAGRVGVLYVDLDRFKTVNDEHGHEVGDLLLVEVAARLSSAVRPQDTVARIGGDEFVVLCPDVPDAAAVSAVAERLLACLGPVVEVGSLRFSVTASIGTAFTAEAATADLQALLRDADAALYSAKAAGRARVQHAGAGEDGELRSAMTLLDELSRAVARGELVVHHQPVVDLDTGVPVGTEALLRWQHPVRGLLGPAEFLDALEMSDLIYGVGLHVLETACADAASLQERSGPLSVHVNVSARQLDRPGLVDAVARTLRRTGLPPHLLVLELTETRLLAVRGSLLQDLHALRALGVRLAADDVGTGYSTLSHLVEMPVDALKLDRSFVSALGREQSAHAVSHGVLAIAQGLGVDCVAEGVEDEVQARLLRALGYRVAQGWLWAPALPLDQLRWWLEDAPRAVSLPRPRTAGSTA